MKIEALILNVNIGGFEAQNQWFCFSLLCVLILEVFRGGGFGLRWDFVEGVEVGVFDHYRLILNMLVL